MAWSHDKLKTEPVMISDDALDLSAEFVQSLKTIYEEDHGRAPTIAELLRTLELTFEAYDDSLSNVENKKVRLDYKLSSQRRQKFAVGDFFSVPLGDNKLGFGFIWQFSPQMGPLGEFLDVVSDKPELLSRLRKAKRLFYTYVGIEHIRSGHWRVLGNGIRVRPESDIPRFVNVSCSIYPGTGKLVVNDEFVRNATPDELQTLPEYSILGPAVVEQQLRDALSK